MDLGEINGALCKNTLLGDEMLAVRCGAALICISPSALKLSPPALIPIFCAGRGVAGGALPARGWLGRAAAPSSLCCSLTYLSFLQTLSFWKNVFVNVAALLLPSIPRLLPTSPSNPAGFGVGFAICWFIALLLSVAPWRV